MQYGKIDVVGLGGVLITDEDSLIIGEYFLEYIGKQLKKKKLQPSSIMRIDEGMTESELKEYKVSMNEQFGKFDSKAESVEDYLQSDQGKKDTIALMEKKDEIKPSLSPDSTRPDKTKIPVRRGRKKGDMMKCIDKIRKYYENKSSFFIKSFMNRQHRFSEDEIKDAVRVLIQNKEVYQISGEEIGVSGKKVATSKKEAVERLSESQLWQETGQKAI